MKMTDQGASSPYAGPIAWTKGVEAGNWNAKYIEAGMDNLAPREVVRISRLHKYQLCLQEKERRCCRLMKVTEFVYWALLVKPVSNGKFERIGLAMLYPHAPYSLGAELTKLEVV